jgi:hypothetical protein
LAAWVGLDVLLPTKPLPACFLTNCHVWGGGHFLLQLGDDDVFGSFALGNFNPETRATRRPLVAPSEYSEIEADNTLA